MLPITCLQANSILDVDPMVLWLAIIAVFFLFHYLLNVLIRERSVEPPKKRQASTEPARRGISTVPNVPSSEQIRQLSQLLNPGASVLRWLEDSMTSAPQDDPLRAAVIAAHEAMQTLLVRLRQLNTESLQHQETLPTGQQTLHSYPVASVQQTVVH